MLVKFLVSASKRRAIFFQCKKQMKKRHIKQAEASSKDEVWKMIKDHCVAVVQSWVNLAAKAWLGICVQNGGCWVVLCNVCVCQTPSGRAALATCSAGWREQGMMTLYHLGNDVIWGERDLDRDNMRVLSCLKTLSLKGTSAQVRVTPKNSLDPRADCQKKVSSALSNNPCSCDSHLVSTLLLKLSCTGENVGIGYPRLFFTL